MAVPRPRGGKSAEAARQREVDSRQARQSGHKVESPRGRDRMTTRHVWERFVVWVVKNSHGPFGYHRMGLGELNTTHSRIAAIYYWLLFFHCLVRARFVVSCIGSEVGNNTAVQIFKVSSLAYYMHRRSLMTHSSDLNQAILGASHTVNLL